MHPFPHHYRAHVDAKPDGPLSVRSGDLAEFSSLPPPEFGGPGGYWSPETLLMAAVGDCMMLTFRAIARASKFEWLALSAEVEGVLDRIEGNSRFTRIDTRVQLTVPRGADAGRARRLLEKAEQGCPISNSLTAARHLECEIVESS